MAKLTVPSFTRGAPTRILYSRAYGHGWHRREPCAFVDRPCSVVRIALGLSVVRECFRCYVRARRLRARLLLAAGAVVLAVVVRVLS